jgi:hypothetical protein
VLVHAADNASVEHIEEGVNGFVVEPSELAAGVVACWDGGAALRERTADWFAAHAEELSIRTSLRRVVERYSARR